MTTITDTPGRITRVGYNLRGAARAAGARTVGAAGTVTIEIHSGPRDAVWWNTEVFSLTLDEVRAIARLYLLPESSS